MQYIQTYVLHTYVYQKPARWLTSCDVSENAFTIYIAGRKNVDSAQRRLHNCQKKKKKKNKIYKIEENKDAYTETHQTHTHTPTHTHTYILVSAKVRCSFWDKKRTFYKTKIGKTLEQKKKKQKKKETKKFIYTKEKT